MKYRLYLLSLLFVLLVACQQDIFSDIEWKYVDYSGQTNERVFENDQEKIKWYTENGYICMDNVIYGPNTFLLASDSITSYYVFDSYGEPSIVKILDEINGFPVTYIYSGFEWCTSLQTIYIGKNCSSIEPDALVGCSSLTNIIIDDENNDLLFVDGLLYIAEPCWGSFIFCSPTVEGRVALPENTIYCSTKTFSVANDVTEIVIGKDLIQFVDYGYLPKLYNIEIAEENEYLLSKDGVIYSKDEKTIEYICPNRYERFEIPESVALFDCTFNHCTKLKTVVINEQLDAEVKFNVNEPHIVPFILHCPSLEEIIVKENNPWLASFNGCLYSKDMKKLYCVPEGMNKVELHEKTETIFIKAFANFRTSSLIIPDSVNSIGFHAFDGSSIKTMVLGSGVVEIDDTAFSNCSSNINNLFYHGTAEQLSKVQIHEHNKYLVLATRYYYSEKRPSSNGRFWHYVNGVATKW